MEMYQQGQNRNVGQVAPPRPNTVSTESVVPVQEGDSHHNRLCRLIEAAEMLDDRLDRIASRALGQPLRSQSASAGSTAPMPPRPVICGFEMANDELNKHLTNIANTIDRLDRLA